jgi:ectoine hydroxylase-related dioxygenase (phytanoyl-CoA dioxygenase family)
MFADLSNFHHLLTDVFTKNADSADFRLSDEQISFFNENGYLTGVKILNDEQIEILRNELSELMKPEQAENPLWYEFNLNESADKSKMLFHALGTWRISKAFHDLLWHQGFCVPASQLLNGAVRFWHDQLFAKPARDGGVVAWHQDYSYWTRTAPIAHLTCWIGLDDSTTENGCLRYVPRSHKWNLLPVTGLTGDMNAIQSVLSDEQKRNFQPVTVELKAGEASFHHPLLVHGSFENFSERPRRATVINVFREGVKSDSDKPPLEGIPPVKKGDKMQGQFFPLLFP